MTDRNKRWSEKNREERRDELIHAAIGAIIGTLCGWGLLYLILHFIAGWW